LDVAGSNYLLWAKTTKAHIFAENLSESIAFDRDFVISPTISPSISWKILLLLCRHLDPSLQHQYLELDKHDELWQKLKLWFNHQRTTFLSDAHQEWAHLRLLDFPTVISFNNAMYRIVSQLCMYD